MIVLNSNTQLVRSGSNHFLLGNVGGLGNASGRGFGDVDTF